MSVNLFIDVLYVIKTNSIDESVDYKLIEPSIEKSQETYIRDLIGTALYNELQDQIEASTVTVLNETLLRDYIAPCLSKYIYYEAIPKLMYKVENISIVKRKTDSADPIDFKELNFIRQIAKDDAEFYGTRITKYLCANQGSYPLYNAPGNTIDTVHPKRNDSFTTSIYLGKNSHWNKKYGYGSDFSN
ncbi:MAG TPA: hypothetical protein PKK61_06580 [Defluviitaleaceae bacterium]|nr:hypothetical protein [Defluviitaleaceae bacterium]